ncbi:MAG: hypothetical protein A2149_06460 [Candidatus Schekmanbacteria bacterium RBG_16_38_11]|uniref:Uncharacterized protein n=1 Tax=Candidatus Schekmanbacteria bacterium RBG_16_38_11 TaxID=1817880 RepID=A0A1F7RX57_9BACT|nr:MAG: hypothetical protein A2149_06460 [Candidatus Schekmanbacteria bacterium RBG_16_38_11]
MHRGILLIEKQPLKILISLDEREKYRINFHFQKVIIYKNYVNFFQLSIKSLFYFNLCFRF